MRELNVNELEQVNGGLVPALVGGFLIRKYGARAAGFAAGALIAWFAE